MNNEHCPRSCGDCDITQVRWLVSGCRTDEVEVDTSLDRKPVQLTKNWRDVVARSSSGEKPSGGILDGLNFADEALTEVNIIMSCSIDLICPTTKFHGAL